MLYCTIFVCIACYVFAYSINSVGDFVQKINIKNSEYNKELGLINGYLKKNKVSSELGIRIQKYLEYIWQGEQLMNSDEEKRIFNKLSHNLKDELLLAVNGKYIHNMKAFSTNFSNKFLNRMASIIEEIRVPPNEIIYENDDKFDKSFYYLLSGEIELFLNNSNNKRIVINKIKPGESFGELSFFTLQNRNENAKSKDYSSFLKIPFERFIKIVSEFSGDFEKYHEIKDQIIFSKKFHKIFLKCNSCQKDTHLTIECPLLHHIPNQRYIIEKYVFSIPHTNRQKQFQRNKKTKENNVLNYKKRHDFGIRKLVSRLEDEKRRIKLQNFLEITEFEEETEESDLSSLIIDDKPKVFASKRNPNKLFVNSTDLLSDPLKFEDKYDNIKQSHMERSRMEKLKSSYSQARRNLMDNEIVNEIINEKIEIYGKKDNPFEDIKSQKTIAKKNEEIERNYNFETIQCYRLYFSEFNVDKIIPLVNKYNVIKFSKKKKIKRLFCNF